MKIKYTDNNDLKHNRAIAEFFGEFKGWGFESLDGAPAVLQIETPGGLLTIKQGETVELKDGAYRKAV